MIPTVQDSQDPPVLPAPYEATEALFEGDDGLRHLIGKEGVFPGGRKRFHSRLDQGVGRACEGQLINDDAA